MPVKSPMQLKHSSRFRRSPRNGEVPAQPPPPAPFASGPQGFIFGALGGVPSRGRGQPGRGGVGNPGHLSRGTQQPLRQEGSARQPSSDKTHRPLRRGTPTRSQAFPPPRALTAPARRSTAPLRRAPGGSSPPPPPSRRRAPATGARRGRPPPLPGGGRAPAAARPAPWRRPPLLPAAPPLPSVSPAPPGQSDVSA